MKPKISCLKTKLMLLLSSLLTIVTGEPSFEALIVNGKESPIEKCPYQVSIRRYGFHRCGGAIVTDYHVITASHCLYPCVNYQIKYLYDVLAGSTKITGRQTFSIANFACHEQYSPQTQDFDVALITLANKLPFSSKIKAIDLPPINYKFTDEFAVISGWGRKKEYGEPATNLQSAEVQIIPRTTCEMAYRDIGKITENMFCAGLTRKDHIMVDSCQGDSGGPMVQDGYLIGIVSWGYGCGRPGYPGVYSNITNFRKWIIGRLQN